MKETRLVRKGCAAACVLLLAVLLLGSAAAVYAYQLLSAALGGRRITAEEEERLSYFQLREQMFASQADVRVSGWLSFVHTDAWAAGTGSDFRRGTQYWPVDGNEDAPWAIVLHGGLGTDRQQVIDIACMLSLAGYHVITPDLYAHGQSAGSISSLGLADARNISEWIRRILIWKPDADIVLFGVDEGAAACLLAGRDLPENVRAVAVDSAYRNARDRAYDLALRARGKLSGFDRLLLDAAFRAVHGVSLDDGDLIEAVKGYPLPLLVIHGTGDKDVPAWHGEDIALAAGENAQLYFAEGAGHGMARFLEPDAYSEMLLSFFDSAISR